MDAVVLHVGTITRIGVASDWIVVAHVYDVLVEVATMTSVTSRGSEDVCDVGRDHVLLSLPLV